jgi:hypothetical protein
VITFAASLRRALPQVELRGTKAAREPAHTWVTTLIASYEEAYETGEFDSEGTRRITDRDTKNGRDAFVELARRELEVDG